MRFLLDANAVIALLNETTSPIARRIRRYAPRDFGVSAVVIPELYYGAFKSQRVEQNVTRVDALQFSVLEFDEEDAREAGRIRAHLASKGTPIGPYDVLIAGQAKARELTLVTHNTTEFQRVPGLKVEDWKGSPPREQRRKPVTRIHDLHRRWRADAGYKDVYDALAEEFDLARSLTDARTAAGRSQSQPGKKRKTSRHRLRASSAKGMSTD